MEMRGQSIKSSKQNLVTENIKPLMIYDGDCEFCQRWVDRFKFVTDNHVDYTPYQDVKNRFSDISESEFVRSVQYVAPDGSRSEGAEAVFRAISTPAKQRWLFAFYLKVPYFAKLAELIYQLVADSRKQ
tara:strand:- start:4135 stop:4521 length:387 start_codon:yes stop_codon:yes gene_type:complete